MSPKTHSWIHNNVLQLNDGAFHIRLFVIFMDRPFPAKENLFRLGQYICNNLNAVPKNNITLSIDEQSFMWLGGDAVWSDVIGCNAALHALFEQTRTNSPSPGYFDVNRDIIHSYFHEGTLSRELAATLHAPDIEIHPSQRQQLVPPAPANDHNNNDGADGNDIANGLRSNSDVDDDDNDDDLEDNDAGDDDNDDNDSNDEKDREDTSYCKLDDSDKEEWADDSDDD